MAKAWMLMGAAAVLALAGCGENRGQAPSDRHAVSPYSQYLAARETALTGQGVVPRVIPVTLPQTAPTPDRIAPQPTQRTSLAVAAAPVVRPRAATQPATGYDSTANVLARYAAALDHDPGEARYTRPGTRIDESRACAGHVSPEAAQIAFIARGGPKLDPLGLDPDGDGFVCGWDPRPIREAGL